MGAVNQAFDEVAPEIAADEPATAGTAVADESTVPETGAAPEATSDEAAEAAEGAEDDEDDEDDDRDPDVGFSKTLDAFTQSPVSFAAAITEIRIGAAVLAAKLNSVPAGALAMEHMTFSELPDDLTAAVSPEHLRLSMQIWERTRQFNTALVAAANTARARKRARNAEIGRQIGSMIAEVFMAKRTTNEELAAGDEPKAAASDEAAPAPACGSGTAMVCGGIGEPAAAAPAADVTASGEVSA